MAESKRNSVAGKIATPKSAGSSATSSAPPMMDPLEALGKAIGARMKLTTAAPDSQTHEGTFFTFCPILNIVAIDTRSALSQATSDAAGQLGNYHVIPVSRIQSFQILSLASAANAGNGTLASAQPAIGPVDIASLKQKTQAKINKLKEEERNRGKGVSKEAQAIFDSFKKLNVPVRWHNQEIIVFDAVIIPPPYRAEDCKAGKDKQAIVIRVKTMLEGEREKLRKKEDQDRKAATPIGPRKGG